MIKYIIGFLVLVACCPSVHGASSKKNRQIKNQENWVHEPTFEQPTSQLVTENQFHSPDFIFWCNEMQEPFRYHRKLWEFCYVAQVLSKKGMLQPGKKGIGFGVGCEPLPALFAKYGCQILASDQDFGTAKEQGWVQSDQYSTEKAKLNKSNICDPSAFEQLVELITIDMNHIDQGLEGFDFTWSCCSLEHIGGLEAGLAFIINSIKCLRPGGVAIHTTEYNLSSNKDTIETPTLSVYRKKDIDSLIQRLEALGYTVAPLNLHRGRGKIDRFVDLPPYKLDPHLRLRLGKYDCTSIGIVIQK